jgi:hypothetical protein
MARPPLSLPLPRPGEAIVTTALAGALGLAIWASLPFAAFAGIAGDGAPVMALVVTPFAFHWLRYGLVTATNAPERGFTLPSSSTAFRIGVRAFSYAPLVMGTLCALIPPLYQGGGGLPYRMLIAFLIGGSAGIVLWGPATLVAIVAYGMPLRAATRVMDAAYPDVVDRALVRTHRRLAIAAAFPLIVGALGYLRARGATEPLDGGPLAVAAFLFFGLLAVAVPVRVALRAQRRLAARKAWTTRDLELVPIAGDTADRLANLPILGTGAAPTHALVRVAAVGAYRSAATPEEPLALVAVADEDRASLRSR